MTSHTNQNANPTTFETSFTVKKIEASFSRSNEKTVLLESLKPLVKDSGWNKKVESLASKKISEEINLENTAGFENYIANLTNFGLQTLPKCIGTKIKEDVSKYFMEFTRPFTETYKEAMLKAAEKNVDYILKTKKEMLPPKHYYIQRPKSDKDKSTQLKPQVKEITIQTFPGLGNYDDHDFDAIVNNDNIEMSYADEDEFNSDDENGKMSEHEENSLIEKLEKLAERQKRMERDYQKAVNPESFLELIEQDFDHRRIIEKIKRLTEFGMKIYDNSVTKTNDSSLPQPEILTFKWKGKYFKLVTSSTWIYQNSDQKLPTEKSKKQLHITEEVYLYLPPPNIIPTKMKWNKEDLEAERLEDNRIPSKIAKIDTSNGEKITKATERTHEQTK